jgi:hypothetical protein
MMNKGDKVKVSYEGRVTDFFKGRTWHEVRVRDDAGLVHSYDVADDAVSIEVIYHQYSYETIVVDGLGYVWQLLHGTDGWLGSKRTDEDYGQERKYAELAQPVTVLREGRDV